MQTEKNPDLTRISNLMESVEKLDRRSANFKNQLEESEAENRKLKLTIAELRAEVNKLKKEIVKLESVVERSGPIDVEMTIGEKRKYDHDMEVYGVLSQNPDAGQIVIKKAEW